MTFKQVLFPIAVAWSVVNLAGLGYAAYFAEPVHATVHGVLAVAFGVWAVQLRRDSGRRAREARVDILEDEISDVRRELRETREGLEFAEQLLAQRPESRRMEPQPYTPKPTESGAIRRELDADSDPNRPAE